MPTVFHPDHVALDKLFTTETQFIIPEYQRPYSWQSLGKSDRNNQINQMWDDLWAFFLDERKDNKEYFFGSMVVIEPELRLLQVVDGQQRVTSLTLLFAAMHWFLEQQLERAENGSVEQGLRKRLQRGINKLEGVIYNEEGSDLVPTLKIKIERAVESGCDYNDILNRAVRGEDISTVPKLESKYKTIAKRYFANRDFFLKQLEACFLGDDGTFSEKHFLEFNKFFSFLLTRVAIVTIKTQDFDTAFNIFEILNNRGLPLTNKDLLRNFIISQFSGAGQTDGAQRWEHLDERYALTDDFIGRFIESTNGKQQRYSAFNDLKARYEAHYTDQVGKPKFLAFYEDMERNLIYYTLIDEPDNQTSDIELANAIKFIGRLGNVRYSTNLMMALFRHYDCKGVGKTEPAVLGFLRDYQQYALYTILSEGSRYSSKRVYESIRNILEGEVGQARNRFKLETRDERRKLVKLLNGKLDNTIGRLLIAGYIWHQQALSGEDVVKQRLDYERCSLEHIIPQKPGNRSRWVTDFPSTFRKEFTLKLGNMTLLTTRRNASAGARDFAEKKKIYKKTELSLTRELASVDELTPKFIEKRHKLIVAGLRAHLGLSTE